MPRLVLLNGAPGIGKSTLARVYAERHPLTLALEIDALKYMIGGWLEQPREAGLAARAMALAAARVQLTAGRDVVLPQLTGLEFILHLEQLAQQTAADFVEILLQAAPDDVVNRFQQRTQRAEHPSHLEAARLLEQYGGEHWLRQAHTALQTVAASRPATICIESKPGEIEATYAALDAAITRGAAQ